MTRVFIDDPRNRFLAASRDGMSARSAAARFGTGISTAIAWIASAREGRLILAKQGRRSGSRLDAPGELHRWHDRRGKGHHAQCLLIIL